MTEQLQKYLLERLLRKRVIGRHHLSFDTVLSGVKPHELGELKEVIYELLKKEFLRWYDKGRKALQLNKYKLKEIREFIH